MHDSVTDPAIATEARLTDDDVQAIDDLRDIYGRLRQELRGSLWGKTM